MAADDPSFYSEGGSSSSSFGFTPLFPYPSLFPYHAIGGSVDAGHLIDASISDSEPSYVKVSEEDSLVSDLHTLDYNLSRHQSRVGTVILDKEYLQLLASLEDARLDEDDSQGDCSDLTESTHTSLTRIVREDHGADHTIKRDDHHVWQHWQASFTPSRQPLEEDEDVDDSVFNAVEQREEQHRRVVKQSLSPISENINEDVHEDAVASFMQAIGSTSLPLVPLRRDHSLGGSPRHSAQDIEMWEKWQPFLASSKTPLITEDDDEEDLQWG